MKKGLAKKFLEHPDKNEIITKLVNNLPAEEISAWLASKYSSISERKLVFSDKDLIEFKEEYLDMYHNIKEDIILLKNSGGLAQEEEIFKSIKNNKTYRQRLNELTDKEIDLKKTIAGVLTAMESRIEQMYDYIQSNPSNFKLDSRMIEWFNAFTNMIEKYNKIVNEAPDKVVQHNVTVQVLDQQINVFYDIILEILSDMDYEASLKFMQLFNDKMSGVKSNFEFPEVKPVDERIADVKMLKETLSKKANEIDIIDSE